MESFRWTLLSLLISSIGAWTGCASTPPRGSTATLQRYVFRNPPRIGRTLDGQDLVLGGFSGLAYLGDDRFLSHTDRGPNPEPRDGKRPFSLPDFQPRLIEVHLDRGT